MKIQDTNPSVDAADGQEVVADTTARKGTFVGMQVIATAVVSAMTWDPQYESVSGGDWSDLTSIPAGAYLPGRFIALTLTSGEVILRRG